MTRIENHHLTGGFLILLAWLIALVMGAASAERANYQGCIKAGHSTVYCSQGYEPYQE